MYRVANNDHIYDAVAASLDLRKLPYNPLWMVPAARPGAFVGLVWA